MRTYNLSPLPWSWTETETDEDGERDGGDLVDANGKEIIETDMGYYGPRDDDRDLFLDAPTLLRQRNELLAAIRGSIKHDTLDPVRYALSMVEDEQMPSELQEVPQERDY